MSNEKDMGGIVFEVSLETSKMLSAQEQVNKSLDNMDDGFNRNAKSASNLESGMTKLASAIKLVMAAAALRGLADMVQRYQEMSERVQMATSSQSEFEQVQQRLLKTANGTYRSLSEAQELYITTAASLRSMNYTTDQAIDVQDSMSYAFVKNATSADRANGAISAFSKSMNKGKVEADSWETIIAAIPSVIDDIATASGKTSAQIRSLGSSGKITANQLSEGLRQSLEANSAAAAGMSNNLTDAGVRMKTAITAILVETEKGTGALQSLTNGIISAADALLNFSGDTQNMPKVIDAITISAMALAAVMSSRLVGALSSATVAQAARTKETISGMIATRAAAVADESAANASARKAAADKSAAMSSLSAAQAELNAMKATTVSTNATIANAEAELASIKVNLQQIQAEKALEIQRARSQITEQGRIATATRMAQLRQAEVLLTQQMARAEAAVTNARATAIATAEAKISAARIAASNATGAAVTANNALAASQSRLAATSISVSSALRVVNTALAPLGGAVGVVAIVAAGWYLYAQQQEQARKESIEFANTLPDVISKLKEMNLVQAQGVRADTIESIKNQEAAIGALKDEIAELSSRYKDAKNAAENSAKGTWLNNDATETAAELAGQLAKKNRDLYEQQGTLKNSTSALQQINVQLNQGILDQMKAARDNAMAVAELEKKTSLLGGSQAFLAEKLGLSTTALQKFNAESLKIDWGGEAGEKLINQAERRLALSKLEGKEKAKQQALYDAEDAKVTDPLAIKQLQDAYAQTEANSEAKKTLAKETAAATKEESAAATEAKNRAKQLTDLNNSIEVTKLEIQGQSRAAAQLAAVQKLGSNATREEIDLAKQQAGAIYDLTVQIDNMHKAKQGQQFAQQEITNAQSPMAQIDIEEQAKLAKLAEYQAIDTQNTQLYEDAKTAIQLQASQQRQRILDDEAAKHTQAISDILGAASQGFDGIAGIIEASGGKASSAYKVLFGISKGFAVAQAALNLQTAISNAMALPWPSNIPAIAQATAAGGQIVSAMSGISYGGGRKNGGGVNADSMYQVGEGGKPEIYQAGTGKQYMIPGDNGKVISNKDMQGGNGGGGTVVQQEVNFHITTTNGIDDATMSKMATMMKQVAIFQMKDQSSRPGGFLQPRKVR
ncbi:tape measure protein [Yersinia enterocolitica]|nr:tape measure protein [Yersinia enterocolitica]EKN3995640.1 tape measure protein [Yersinia enterocolitica]EKP3834256.1 tape measure protein [Yersinia enterocolitica]ELI8138519.1 tape measure protein [Yersinia enterocolitica]ELI8440327.1 tape measure protein [Yersinia enterocolitica]